MTDSRNPIAPGDIEARSFEIIESEVPEPRPYQGGQWSVVRRMIHASADFDLLRLVRFHPEALSSGLQALTRGCTILTDTQMTRAGITSGRMERLGCSVNCHLSDPDVVELAGRQNLTRTAAAVRKGLDRLDGAVYVLGNAPTALFELLSQTEATGRRPALIVGMPVGFVGAAESKQALAARTDLPCITLQGRKGGSALAAACVNGLAELALAEKG